MEEATKEEGASLELKDAEVEEIFWRKLKVIGFTADEMFETVAVGKSPAHDDGGRGLSSESSRTGACAGAGTEFAVAKPIGASARTEAVAAETTFAVEVIDFVAPEAEFAKAETGFFRADVDTTAAGVGCAAAEIGTAATGAWER